MQGLVNQLLQKHISPIKMRKYNATLSEHLVERKTQADLVLNAYDYIKTALHNSPVDIRTNDSYTV